MTTPSVSEEMIQAALQAWFYPIQPPEDEDYSQDMRAALEAAFAYLPAGSEAVKPLEWVEGYGPAQYASAVGMGYSIHQAGLKFEWVLLINGERTGERFTSESDAKAAAQADFEQRVLPCLAPPSTPPAANVQEIDGLIEDLKLAATDRGHWVDLADHRERAAKRLLDARDALREAFLRSKQAPTVAVPDGGLEQWRYRAIGKHVGEWSDWNEGTAPDLRTDDYEVETRILRARAEQREAPSVVVGGV